MENVDQQILTRVEQILINLLPPTDSEQIMAEFHDHFSLAYQEQQKAVLQEQQATTLQEQQEASFNVQQAVEYQKQIEIAYHEQLALNEQNIVAYQEKLAAAYQENEELQQRPDIIFYYFIAVLNPNKILPEKARIAAMHMVRRGLKSASAEVKGLLSQYTSYFLTPEFLYSDFTEQAISSISALAAELIINELMPISLEVISQFVENAATADFAERLVHELILNKFNVDYQIPMYLFQFINISTDEIFPQILEEFAESNPLEVAVLINEYLNLPIETFSSFIVSKLITTVAVVLDYVVEGTEGLINFLLQGISANEDSISCAAAGAFQTASCPEDTVSRALELLYLRLNSEDEFDVNYGIAMQCSLSIKKIAEDFPDCSKSLLLELIARDDQPIRVLRAYSTIAPILSEDDLNSLMPILDEAQKSIDNPNNMFSARFCQKDIIYLLKEIAQYHPMIEGYNIAMNIVVDLFPSILNADDPFIRMQTMRCLPELLENVQLPLNPYLQILVQASEILPADEQINLANVVSAFFRTCECNEQSLISSEHFVSYLANLCNNILADNDYNLIKTNSIHIICSITEKGFSDINGNILKMIGEKMIEFLYNECNDDDICTYIINIFASILRSSMENPYITAIIECLPKILSSSLIGSKITVWAFCSDILQLKPDLMNEILMNSLIESTDNMDSQIISTDMICNMALFYFNLLEISNQKEIFSGDRIHHLKEICVSGLNDPNADSQDYVNIVCFLFKLMSVFPQKLDIEQEIIEMMEVIVESMDEALSNLKDMCIANMSIYLQYKSQGS